MVMPLLGGGSVGRVVGSAVVAVRPARVVSLGGHGGLRGEASKRKRVVFADAKGLSLTAVRIFSETEKSPHVVCLPPRPELRNTTVWGSGFPVSTSGPGPRPRLGFPQPPAEFRTFHARLGVGMVLLENFSVNAQALQGTVLVKNVSYQKAVRVRVTFDSWLSFLDVPCVFLQQRYTGPERDVFAFDIALPKLLKEKEKMEFCISYLPGGYSTAFWDNNNGQNYRLCQQQLLSTQPSKQGGLWEIK